LRIRLKKNAAEAVEMIHHVPGIEVIYSDSYGAQKLIQDSTGETLGVARTL